MTVHFYWVGAIFAMVFLGVFMMPFYYGSRARSVPEYLKLRFDEKTRGLNAVSFAVMTVFSSGISLYALAKLLEIILGWDFDISIWIAAGVVMIYTFLGGLTSAVYNEVLQFFLIVLGLSPLVIVALHDAGGWANIKSHLPPELTHAWKYMGNAKSNPMGLHFTSLIFGLGFVMSFGYWCTDFLVVQRAMIAKNMTAAQQTPIVAALPKMLMPFIVVLPGVIAVASGCWSAEPERFSCQKPDAQTHCHYSRQQIWRNGLHHDPTFINCPLLSKRVTGRGHHRTYRIFHERHGWKCHRIQFCVYL